MSKNTTLKIIRAGVISALYVALSFFTLPISGGIIQFRISEGLTLLPLLYVESVPALFIGCLIFNLFTLPIYDVFLGSLVTLLSAVCTYLIGKLIRGDAGKIVLGGIFPVALNALILPLVWYVFSGVKDMYLISCGSIFISQSLSVYVIGTLLYLAVKRTKRAGARFL